MSRWAVVTFEKWFCSNKYEIHMVHGQDKGKTRPKSSVFCLAFLQQVLTEQPLCGLGSLTVLGRQDLSLQKNNLAFPAWAFFITRNFSCPSSLLWQEDNNIRPFAWQESQRCSSQTPDSSGEWRIKLFVNCASEAKPWPCSCVEADLELCPCVLLYPPSGILGGVRQQLTVWQEGPTVPGLGCSASWPLMQIFCQDSWVTLGTLPAFLFFCSVSSTSGFFSLSTFGWHWSGC